MEVGKEHRPTIVKSLDPENEYVVALEKRFGSGDLEPGFSSFASHFFRRCLLLRWHVLSLYRIRIDNDNYRPWLEAWNNIFQEGNWFAEVMISQDNENHVKQVFWE